MRLSTDQAITEINKIERELTTVGCATSICAMGVEFAWEALPLSKGGKIKRGNAYGIIRYSCDGIPILTKADLLDEITKPQELKQALKEATAIMECTMCGKIISGNHALHAFDDYITEFKAHGIQRTVNYAWRSFKFDYKRDYEVRQLNRQLIKTDDPFNKNLILKQMNELVNQPINYDIDRMEIILCYDCMESIYNGEYKDNDEIKEAKI